MLVGRGRARYLPRVIFLAIPWSTGDPSPPLPAVSREPPGVQPQHPPPPPHHGPSRRAALGPGVHGPAPQARNGAPPPSSAARVTLPLFQLRYVKRMSKCRSWGRRTPPSWAPRRAAPAAVGLLGPPKHPPALPAGSLPAPRVLGCRASLPAGPEQSGFSLQGHVPGQAACAQPDARVNAAAGHPTHARFRGEKPLPAAAAEGAAREPVAAAPLGLYPPARLCLRGVIYFMGT